MDRFLFGVFLLVVLLAVGLWSSFTMSDIHSNLCQTLSDAAEKTLEGDMEKGITLAKQAKQTWQMRWSRTAAMADHAPMDEIDGLFSQLEAYAEAKEATEFAALCGRLSQLVDAVGESHSLTWWNLL